MEKQQDNNLNDLFSESNIPTSAWFKFSVVGDKVGGTVVDIYEKAGEGEFPAQKVFVILQKNGEEVNVGIKKDNEYLVQRTKKVRPGDLIGFEFTKEIPATKKGYNPAKSITPFVKYTEAGDVVRNGESIMNS